MNRLAMPVAAAAALVASGCGNVGPLQPRPGEPLPVRPLLARTTPTPDQLLTAPTYANPERVDELITRSEPRRPDRFDMPPPEGGAAPGSLPAGSDPEPKDDEEGPATPE